MLPALENALQVPVTSGNDVAALVDVMVLTNPFAADGPVHPNAVDRQDAAPLALLRAYADAVAPAIDGVGATQHTVVTAVESRAVLAQAPLPVVAASVTVKEAGK